MTINIRQETEREYTTSEYIIGKAFEIAEYSDHQEQFLVAGLRESEVFVPQLSLVAKYEEGF